MDETKNSDNIHRIFQWHGIDKHKTTTIKHEKI